MLSEKWQNYGDVNHREHGGQFVKFNKETNSLEIVQTSDVSEHEGIGGKYLFEYAWVDVKDLTKDMDLVKFAGADQRGLSEDDKLIYLATSYIAYQGSDDGGNLVNNYWEELKSYGITPSKTRNI